MRIVVVGGGYAGTFVANRVARRLDQADITLVNPRPFFVDRVRLHKQVAATGRADAPWSTMLADSVTSVVDTAVGVADGRVTTQSGERFDFDRAVVAVGSSVRPLDGTVAVGTWEDASRAREALANVASGGCVTVVGGGPTGIETASEIAEARPDVQVRLLAQELAPTMRGGAPERIRRGLDKLGVEIVEAALTSVDRAEGEDGRRLVLASGDSLESDLTLWSIVGGVPSLVADSGLRVDEQGRAVVDEYLRSVSDDRVFVIGDCAAVPGARMACQTALPEATHTADNLVRLDKGESLQPFHLKAPGLGVSLGKRDAVGQLTRRDGSFQTSYVSGPPAVLVKEIGARGAKFVTRVGRGV